MLFSKLEKTMLSTIYYILSSVVILYGIFFGADLLFDVLSICLICYPLIHSTVLTIWLASKPFRCEACGHTFKVKWFGLFCACFPCRVPYVMKKRKINRLRGFNDKYKFYREHFPLIEQASAMIADDDDMLTYVYVLISIIGHKADLKYLPVPDRQRVDTDFLPLFSLLPPRVL